LRARVVGIGVDVKNILGTEPADGKGGSRDVLGAAQRLLTV
jgi:hypothetical protein